MSVEESSPVPSRSLRGGDLAEVSPEVAAALAALDAATDVLAGVDLLSLDGRQAAVITARVAAATSRLTGARARMLAVVEADGLWAVDGAKSFAQWVAYRDRLPIQTARAHASLGRTLRDDLPLTAQAVLAGRIGAEHAGVLARFAPTTEQRRQVLADPGSEVNEAFLVAQAQVMGPDDLRTLTRQWAAYTDPDADDQGYVAACEREHLEISRLYDMYDVRGLLTPEHGQALKAALRAVIGVPAVGDGRSASQRRAHALADLATVAVDVELAGVGRTARPRINVLIDHPTLVALAATARARGEQGELDTSSGPVRTPPVATAAMLTGRAVAVGPQYEDGTPIPRALLDQLACDSAIGRIIFGPTSEVLDVGRAERTFSGPRRNALVARDKHCRYPGCTAPPVLCDGHHIDHWARDHGRTAVHRGILLCTFHHGHVHRHRIEITPHASGFRFTDCNGSKITVDAGRQQPLLL